MKQGHNINVKGIGRFSITISADGEINVHVKADHHLKSRLNETDGFEGTILNKDMISPKNEKIIAAWNKAHPDDPVETLA